MSRKLIISFFALCFTLLSFDAFSGVTLSGTRLIFNGNRDEAAITVTNPDDRSYLIQSWVGEDNKKSPEFVVTPPLFRMDEKTSNSLRVVLVKNDLPQNKESLFWLNVKAIPPSDPNATNNLLVAINTKIKLIYRPESLMNIEKSTTAYRALTFKVDSAQQHLIISNPTAYYVNLAQLTYNNKDVDDLVPVAPFSDVIFNIKPVSNGKVTWTSINDYGGVTPVLSKEIK